MKTDAALQRDVMDELKWEPTIKAAEIGVGVTDGVVTLSGYVDTYGEKWTAERTAARVFLASRRWRRNSKSGCLKLYNARMRILPRRRQMSSNRMSG